MGSPKKRIQYRFDAVGNRIGMTDPDGGRFTYAYDAVDRITQVVNPQGDRTSYAYDAGGRRTVKKLANGTRASFSYDAASNLTRLANLKSDGTTISSFNYEYDRVGNRTAVLEADGSRVTWSYDDTYQLTGEHRTGTTPYEDSYSYDTAGNRLLKVHDGARTTYSYDAANQLEWSEDGSGRTTYTFDADGNQQLVVEPTGDRTTTSWDYENRTTLVQLPSGIRNTMAYEPGGLRVKLEESTGTKKFVWDGRNYLASLDSNDDIDGLYTNAPIGYGSLISCRTAAATQWNCYDALGSQRNVTDPSANVIATHVYDGWGLQISSTGDTSGVFKYLAVYGYFRDTDTNLYYVRSRLYQAALGQWLSPDPLFTVHRVATQRYSYVLNSPLVLMDPSGLQQQGAEELDENCECCRAEMEYRLGILNNFRVQPTTGVSGRRRAKVCVVEGACQRQCGDAGHLVASTDYEYQPDEPEALITICVRCDTPLAMLDFVFDHEFVHVHRFCSQAAGIGSCADCLQEEGSAYKQSCARIWDLNVSAKHHRCYNTCLECGAKIGCSTRFVDPRTNFPCGGAVGDCGLKDITGIAVNPGDETDDCVALLHPPRPRRPSRELAPL